MGLRKLPRAEVRPVAGGLIWEVWWRRDMLFATTNEATAREFADTINMGRR